MSSSDQHGTKLASSTGQDFTSSGHLDLHFQNAVEAYRKAFHFVGMQPSWRVLDAGCGNGAFLPWIANAVGAGGQIDAIDLAPDNIALVNQLVPMLGVALKAQIGTLTQLPYPDATFDAIWCANVTQYLSESDLWSILGEFCRVCKPGGKIAIKDHDITLWLMQPLDPLIGPRLWQRILAVGETHMKGVLRTSSLGAYMRQAGIKEIRSITTLSEYHGPAHGATRAYLGGVAQYFGTLAQQFELSLDDLNAWRKLADIQDSDHIMNLPDFYCREGDYTFVGVV